MLKKNSLKSSKMLSDEFKSSLIAKKLTTKYSSIFRKDKSNDTVTLNRYLNKYSSSNSLYSKLYNETYLALSKQFIKKILLKIYIKSKEALIMPCENYIYVLFT